MELIGVLPLIVPDEYEYVAFWPQYKPPYVLAALLLLLITLPPCIYKAVPGFPNVIPPPLLADVLF